MNLKDIPVSYQPAYTWLWNTTITKEEINRQIDEMYECGIRAFYIIGEPKNFCPDSRCTYLSPEYLSEEYIDLVYYAFEQANAKGMYTWLYNEGGFPSGMVCGKIRKLYPELARKNVAVTKEILSTGTIYRAPEKELASFVDGKRITDGASFPTEVQITRYSMEDVGGEYGIHSDNAVRKNTDVFLELTHEALKKRFGEHMGHEVTMMFDDEAFMGRWTEGLEKLFKEQYGYEIEDYLPMILGEEEAYTLEQKRAIIDYRMLCGDLIYDNYFVPMRQWLNSHNMLSVGHLDKDSSSNGVRWRSYGNMLRLLRTFDVPGVDVIWSQITYPTNGVCCHEGNEFFPRLASSAAHQQGHSRCLSESFAVYGADVTPEEMRFVVNYQAVRGISLFNFMVMSFARDGVLQFQYRPNFIADNPGMDCLKQINDYTARLSYLLQNSQPDVTSALYVPQRTISAGGVEGAAAEKAYDDMGMLLERSGVSFDLLDEELVQQGQVIDGKLVLEHVAYEHIFVPDGTFELTEVLDKLRLVDSQKIPCIQRVCEEIAGRKVSFSDGSEGYFICSSSADTLEDTIIIETDKIPYELDLYTGNIYAIDYERCNGTIVFSVRFLRGEGMFVWLTEERQDADPRPRYEKEVLLEQFTSYVSRKCDFHPMEGYRNLYYEDAEKIEGLQPWPVEFSGEVTYQTILPSIPQGDLRLDLGDVNYYAKVYLNGKKIGEATMPPYVIPLEHAKQGDELQIVVANTIANICHNSEYLQSQQMKDIGPYHANMIKREAKAPAGGLLGPVWIAKKWNGGNENAN